MNFYLNHVHFEDDNHVDIVLNEKNLLISLFSKENPIISNKIHSIPLLKIPIYHRHRRFEYYLEEEERNQILLFSFKFKFIRSQILFISIRNPLNENRTRMNKIRRLADEITYC